MAAPFQFPNAHKLSALDDLLQAAPVALFRVDEFGLCTSVNDEWRTLTGHTMTRPADILFSGAVHPDDRQRVSAFLAHPGDLGAPFSYRIVQPGGEVRQVETRLKPAHPTQAPGFIGSVVDVTERHRMTEIAHSQQAIAHALFENSPLGMQSFTVDGTLIESNETRRAQLGLPSRLAGAGEYNLLDDEWTEGQEIRQAFQLAASGEIVDLTTPHADRTGLEPPGLSGQRMVEQGLYFAPGFLGEPDQVVLITRDVTSRIDADEQLRQSENRLRAMFDAISDAIVIVDAEFREIAANSIYRRMFEPEGEHPTIQVGRFVSDQVALERAVRTLRETGRLDTVVPAINAAGEPWSMELHAATIPGPGGTVAGCAIVCRDVSERERSARELRESEQRFRAMFDSVADAIMVADKDFTVLQVNEPYRRLFRFEGNVDELRIGRYIKDQVAVEQALVNLRATGKSRGVVDGLHPEGKPWKIEHDASAILSATGEVEGYIGVFRDVTEDHQAEERLRQSERRFRMVFEGASDAMCIRGAEGLVAVNQAYREMFGIREADLSSISSADLFQRDEDLDEAVAALQQTGRCTRTLDCRRLDGTSIQVEAKLSLLRAEDGTVKSLGIFRDVTAELAQKRALEISEANFRAALEDAADAVLVLDLDETKRFIISYSNREATRILNTSSEKLAGRPFSDFVNDWAAVPDAMAQLMTGATVQREVVRDFGDGPRAISVRFTSTHNPASGQRRFIAIARDVTDARIAERQANEIRQLQSLSRMAGGVAHDFNNALQAIIVGTDVALMMAEPEWDGREVLADVRSAATQAATVARKMLSFSGSARFMEHEMAIDDLLHDLANGPLPADTPARPVQVQPLEVPLAIRGDREHLREALLQIVVNARESVGARPDGQVWIRAGEVHATREMLARGHMTPDLPPGRYVFIEVADNGVGMNAETRERQFDPFFSTKFVGRGMGLPAALGVVRAHHGTIIVDSEPGRGTTVRVLLPAIGS